MKTKNIVSVIIIALLLAGLSSCEVLRKQPEPVVQKPFVPPFRVMEAGDTQELKVPGGIYYTLPQSRLEVTFTLTRIEQVKGPYAGFAGKYLGIDNVISANSVTWQIDDISISSVAIPDTAQTYYIAMGEGDSASVPLSLIINLNAMGALSGTTPGASVQQVENNFISPSRSRYSSVFKYFSEDNLFEVVDTVIEKVTSDTQTIETKVLQKKMVEKPAEQKAKEAADFIQKIKDLRISLLTGYQEIPYDPATIRYMATELEQMEMDYIELFTGVSLATTYKRTFVYIPKKQDDCLPVSIGRFSTAEGFLPNESPRGEPVFIQVCSQGGTAAGHMNQPLFVHSKPAENQQGFVYRIPEWSVVSIYLGQKLQKDMGILIPQLGSVQRLPWFVTHFELDPETGAIIRIQYP